MQKLVIKEHIVYLLVPGIFLCRVPLQKHFPRHASKTGPQALYPVEPTKLMDHRGAAGHRTWSDPNIFKC